MAISLARNGAETNFVTSQGISLAEVCYMNDNLELFKAFAQVDQKFDPAAVRGALST